MNNSDLQRIKSWGVVFAWVGLIYSTLYIVKPICVFLKKNTPFDLLVNSGLAGLFILIAVLFFKKITIRKISTYFMLLFVFIAYLISLKAIQYPEEKLHLLEYGFLAFLCYKALSHDFDKARVYIAGFILTSIFGILDEVIQYFIPNRHCQISDMALNSISGALALFLIYIIQREKPIVSVVPPRIDTE